MFDKSISDEKIDAINKWMDNPAMKTGQYKIKRTGHLVTPKNHRQLRHKPSNVARVLSGTGRANREIQKVAQIHLLVDKGFNLKEIREIMMKGRPSKAR